MCRLFTILNRKRVIHALVFVALCVAVIVALTFIFNVAFKHDEPLVYITRTGHKYHNESCAYLWASAIPIGKDEAVKKGYTACSQCGGKSCGIIVVNNYGVSFAISAFTVIISVVCYSNVNTKRSCKNKK